jgi:hypothetical protein
MILVHFFTKRPAVFALGSGLKSACMLVMSDASMERFSTH